MAETRERRWTLDEFLEWSEGKASRYELVNGQPLRMTAGAKRIHDDIVANITLDLGPQVINPGCRSFAGDGAVQPVSGQIGRSDSAVDCGRCPTKAFEAQTPRAGGEVLAPSTRDVDIREKLENYKSVATLKHIGVVEPDSSFVSLWSRETGVVCSEPRIQNFGERVRRPGVGADVAMRAFYTGVAFLSETHLVVST